MSIILQLYKKLTAHYLLVAAAVMIILTWWIWMCVNLNAETQYVVQAFCNLGAAIAVN